LADQFIIIIKKCNKNVIKLNNFKVAGKTITLCICCLCLYLSMYINKYKLSKTVHLLILNTGRLFKVNALLGRALLKEDIFLFEYDVVLVTDLLVPLVVGGRYFRSTFFC